MHSLLSSTNDLVVLTAEEGHAMITDVLVLLRLDIVTCFARGKHGLITDTTHTHEVDLFTRHTNSFNHFSNFLTTIKSNNYKNYYKSG